MYIDMENERFLIKRTPLAHAFIYSFLAFIT